MSQLPQDDMAKYTMAQIARSGVVPLLADDFILDKVLGIQDSEQAQNQVKAQQAERGLPEAGLYELMKASEDQGDRVVAGIYYKKLLELMGLAPKSPIPQDGTQSQHRGGRQVATLGNRPEVMPQAAMGTPPSPATSNNAVLPIAPQILGA